MYCSYCEASVSVFGRHGCTKISTLHGFNIFPHWRTRITFVPLGVYDVSRVPPFSKWLNRLFLPSLLCMYISWIL